MVYEYELTDGVAGQEYSLTYNGAGSLESDAGRRIARIDYDMMNNPIRIQFTNGNVTRYIYSASARLCRFPSHQSQQSTKAILRNYKIL